jgi:O-antigen/teichoic acid export membrane protein
LTAILSLLNQRADLLIVNAFAAPAIVGQYSIALSLTTLQLLVPYALSRLVIPRVSSLHASDSQSDHQPIIVKSIRHGVFISTAAAIAMAAGLLAVPYVFGSGFQDAVTLGWILVPGTAALGLANVLGATITGSGKPQYLLVTAAIVTPLTFALYLALIPTMKATGGALASTASYGLTLCISWLFFRQVSGITRLGPLVPRVDEISDYWQLTRATLRTLARRRPA